MVINLKNLNCNIFILIYKQWDTKENIPYTLLTFLILEFLKNKKKNI